MNEEHIIARARQEVAARRAQAAEQRGHALGGVWQWAPVTLALAVLTGFFAVPGALSRKLLLAMGGVCALRPSHSYFAGGVQFPLESRMMGIYGGAMLTLGVLLLAGRAGARRLGGWPTVGVLLLMFSSMAFDGVNSTLADLGWPHLYTPTNGMRLLTGLLAGIAIAPFLLWLIGLVMLPATRLRPAGLVRAPWDLLAPLAVNAGFGLLIVDGRALWYYPLAFISAGGIVAVLAGAALIPVLTLSGLEGRVRRVRDLLAPGAVALLIAFAVLAGMAALRWNIAAGM